MLYGKTCIFVYMYYEINAYKTMHLHEYHFDNKVIFKLGHGIEFSGLFSYRQLH